SISELPVDDPAPVRRPGTAALDDVLCVGQPDRWSAGKGRDPVELIVAATGAARVEHTVGLRRKHWKDKRTSALRRKRVGCDNRAVSVLAAHPYCGRSASLARVNKRFPM